MQLTRTSHISKRQPAQNLSEFNKGPGLISAAKWIGSLIVTAAITILMTPSIFKPIAKMLSRQSSVTGFIDMKEQSADCTVWTLALFPIEPIKSLNMIVNLDQPISQSVLQNGLDVNPNPTQSMRVRVNRSCEIVTGSSGTDSALTFNLSSDRRQVVVKGHDLSRYDAQTFVGVFRHNPTNHINLDVMADAIYESFGYDFPAAVHIIDQQSGKDVMAQ